MMTPTITYYFYCWLDTPQEEKQRIVEQVREHCPKQINQFNRLIDGHSRQNFTRLIEQQTTHLFDTNNNQHLAGKTVDKYQLLKLAGQGGMGTVYEAKRVDQLFEQRVAIKFYHAHLSKLSSPPFLLKEAQVLANLNHVSIPKVYDAGLYKDNVYIVMEYIEGKTLDQYLAKTSLSSEQRYLLCLEICSAIEHAHQYGLLHADLKPENLLIDKNGKPKVLDFNIVQPSFIHHSPATKMLRTYSQGYSSPEQKKGQSISIQSDIYSLGKLIQKILNPNCYHYELALVINIACHECHDQRYQSVSDLIIDLQNLREKKPISLLQTHIFYCVKKSVQRYRTRWFLGVLSTFALGGFSTALAEKNHDLRQEEHTKEMLVKEFSNLIYVSRTTLQSERDMVTIVDNMHEFVMRTSNLPTEVKTQLAYALTLPTSDNYTIEQSKTITVPLRNGQKSE